MISTNKIAFSQAIRKRIYEQVADLFSGLLDFYTAFGLRASRDDPKAFIHWLKIGSDLGEEITLYRLVDNHDIQRIYNVAGKNTDLTKIYIAAAFAGTNPTIIYYGTEIPMSGTLGEENFKEYKDMGARRFMEWDKEPQLSEYIHILNEIKQKTRKSQIDVVNNGEAATIHMETRRKEYLLVINPSLRLVDLNSIYSNLELGTDIRRTPPRSARVLEG